MSEEKPIRILQCVNKMDRAGLETMLMNYYREIDKSKIQFDFLTHRAEDGAYDEEIKKMGGKIFHAPRLVPQNYLKYSKYMKELFMNNPEYTIIHSHIDTMSYFPLKEAKKNNIPFRISHSHSSKLDIDYKLPIKYYAKLNIKKVANIFLACGQKAGEFLYGKNEHFELVNNAINIENFKYNKRKRIEVRKKLNINSDTLVIGHVGRYIYIKNQIFLISLFNEILKKNRNSLLLLIGSGNDEKKLKEKVKKLGIENKVLFLIDRKDVADLYQAMDVFVMPSLFEGLPLVGVEAQVNGLPCLFSNKISEEILMTDNACMVDLKKGHQFWAEKILKINVSRNKNAIKQVSKCGFDIKEEVKNIQNFYEKLK